MLQQETNRKLMDQLQPIIGWAMDKVGAARQYDLDFKAIFEDINDYDRAVARSIQGKLVLLTRIKERLEAWVVEKEVELKAPDYRNINLINKVVSGELLFIQNRFDYLSQYSSDKTTPYLLMTDQGTLWKQPALGYNTDTLKQRGWEYFKTLSRMNREGMQKEYDPLASSNEWVGIIRANLEEALSHVVLNHYTTRNRGVQLIKQGALKSKLRLELEIDNYKHNTSVYDEYVLANSGFIFFFVEPQSALLRATRFAKDNSSASDEGGAARIVLQLDASGLLDNGWMMLSDFAQREFPHIASNGPDSDEYESWLPTREQKSGFPTLVKHFENISDPLSEDDMEMIQQEKNAGKRQALITSISQARGDKLSKQIYGKEDVQYPERLLDNILVGPDIIPGLVMRTTLEISRIEKVNTKLAARFKKLSGDDLILFVFKDLFRPQAMLPNVVAITDKNLI